MADPIGAYSNQLDFSQLDPVGNFLEAKKAAERRRQAQAQYDPNWTNTTVTQGQALPPGYGDAAMNAPDFQQMARLLLSMRGGS